MMDISDFDQHVINSIITACSRTIEEPAHRMSDMQEGTDPHARHALSEYYRWRNTEAIIEDARAIFPGGRCNDIELVAIALHIKHTAFDELTRAIQQANNHQLIEYTYSKNPWTQQVLVNQFSSTMRAPGTKHSEYVWSRILSNLFTLEERTAIIRDILNFNR
ncbi:hypothetical protein AB0O14_19220 [Microbacterium foliorum]|uniref:hypothetical protein n=1 Tax=Rothia terrae TaxID=396015 RepID=UPI0034275CA3